MEELPYNEFGFITDTKLVNKIITTFKENKDNNKDSLWYILNKYTNKEPIFKHYYNVVDIYTHDFFIETAFIKINFNVQLKDYYFKYYDWYTDPIHKYDINTICKNLNKIRSVSMNINGVNRDILIYNVSLETKEPISI